MKSKSLFTGWLIAASTTTLVVFALGTSVVRADETKGASRLTQLSRAGATSTTDASKASCLTVCCDSTKQSITTGTQLPTRSKKRLQITDTAQNLKVLDRKQLDRTGSANVSDAVRKLVP